MKRFGLLRLSARRWSVMEFVGMSRTEDGVDYESWFNTETLENGAEAIALIRKLTHEAHDTSRGEAQTIDGVAMLAANRAHD